MAPTGYPRRMTTFSRRETGASIRGSESRRLEVRCTEGADGRLEYTFVPRNVDDDERVTTWITASAEVVVSLADWR